MPLHKPTREDNETFKRLGLAWKQSFHVSWPEYSADWNFCLKFCTKNESPINIGLTTDSDLNQAVKPKIVCFLLPWFPTIPAIKRARRICD